MPTQAHSGLPKDPQILRTIVREAEQNLGVYAHVSRAGHVRVGDALMLVEDARAS
jgi:MOSC domain-containing protein YiiM